MKQPYLLFLFFSLQASEEFLYPVDTILHDGQDKLCILHQKGNRLELWFWNPSDKSATKALLSSFTPAGLTVLPNKEGFSFIDGDRVRVKFVDKRSPKSIELYGPYDLTKISWIDSENFYFAAKERQHSNLFHATIEGDIFRLTLSDENDYLYPQKVGNDFFFIERSDEKGYSIMHIDYPTKELDQQCKKVINFEARIQLALEPLQTSYRSFLDLEQASRLIRITDTTIAFLSMESSEFGFFLEHPNMVDRDDDAMEFKYHLLYKDKEIWKSRKIFDFLLPLHLMLPKRGRTRLYESILPLLPFYSKEDKKIYFSNYNQKMDTLNVFVYCLTSDSIIQKTDSQFYSQNYFTPRTITGSLFCGGTVINSIRNIVNPHIEIDENGTQLFSFKEISAP